MSSPRVTELARELQSAGIGIPETVPPNLARIAVAIYRALATGSPLAPTQLESLTSASGVPADLVRVAAARWLELDEAGSLTGFGGLTLRPTQHRLILDGKDFYLWCALDGFLVAHVLGQPVRIETLCPATGTPIEVAVSREGVEHLAPSDAVMSVMVPESNAACSVSETRRGFCDFVSFYRSEQVAFESMKRPGTTVVTMDQGFALARLLMLPLINASS